MEEVKLYNVIFPVWFLLFFPPVILLTLLGNFIIDSLVLIICYFGFKLRSVGTLKDFYRQSIMKVWLYGFLADIIGAALLFVLGMAGDSLGVPYDIISAISYDPFRHPLAVMIVLAAMVLSSVFIWWFNFKFALVKALEDRLLRFRVALTIAIVTIPWTFILPTKWFYR